MFKLFCGFLASGLSGKMVEERTFVRPNQGIRRSAHYSVSVGSIFGLLIMSIVGPIQCLTLNSRDWRLITLSYGLLSIPLIGLANGGVTRIQHGILRLLLWHIGSIPRHYTRFLDYAAEHVLLRKVGGGYIFIHRLLLEHFTIQNAIPTSTMSISKYPLVTIKNGQEHLEEQETDGHQVTTPRRPLQPSTPPSEGPHLKQSGTRRVGLIMTLVMLLVAAFGAGTVLHLDLFLKQPIHIGSTQPPAQITSVGQVVFTSSGQVDPDNSKGLNDIVTVSLHNLLTPAPGKSYFAWLLPERFNETTYPLLLGKLAIRGEKAQLTYVHPDHDNLLASYSILEVRELQSDQVSIMPPHDPKTLRYVGSIPNIPTPGDERHFSLLDHLRHLLAKDPTLRENGLAGGLDIWLYRNTEKILEWSSAARDSWTQRQTDLIHRHMIRVLDYLDGAAYVSGDLPPNAPLLVDPQAGRIGLLQVSQVQKLPAYLTHVSIHLQGLVNAPGNTQQQRHLANKINAALDQVTSLMQKIHQEAVTLVKMDNTQLQSQNALALLNDMVTNANSAYVGQSDPVTSYSINGVTWIHNELQGLATIPITTLTADNESLGSQRVQE